MPVDDRDNLFLLGRKVAPLEGVSSAELATLAQTSDALSQLLASWDRWLSADRDLDRILDLRLQRLEDDIGEIRDELLALSNRIEATNRALSSRTDHLA